MYCRKSRIEWLSACDLCLKYDGLVQRMEVAGTKYSFFLPILLHGISKKIEPIPWCLVIFYMLIITKLAFPHFANKTKLSRKFDGAQ